MWQHCHQGLQLHVERHKRAAGPSLAVSAPQQEGSALGCSTSEPARRKAFMPGTQSLPRQALHAQVLEWLAQHVRGAASAPATAALGRFESEPAWRMAVSKRRAAAAPETPFLQDLQAALTDAHVRFSRMSSPLQAKIVTQQHIDVCISALLSS